MLLSSHGCAYRLFVPSRRCRTEDRTRTQRGWRPCRPDGRHWPWQSCSRPAPPSLVRAKFIAGHMCRVSERGAPTKYLLMLSQGRSSPRGGRPRAVASLTPARFPRSRCGLCNASSRCRRRRQAAGVGEPGQVAGAARQTCTGQEGGQRRGRCCFCAHSPHAAGAEGGSHYPSQPRP